MAAINDNARFLYHCLTESKHKIDWKVVGDAVGLKSATACKRWSRLQERLNKPGGVGGTVPASPAIDETTLLLYQCIVHSSCKIDFDAVGKVTGLKTATASKRWSRLQDKIKKQQSDGSAAHSDSEGQPAEVQKPQRSEKPKPAKKRKAKAPEDDVEEDGDDGEVCKKFKVEREDDDSEPATKRATRGKVIDFKGMIEKDSTTGSSSTGTNLSSIYQAGASNTSFEDEMAEDDDLASEATDMQIRKLPAAKAKVSANARPSKAAGASRRSLPAKSLTKTTTAPKGTPRINAIPASQSLATNPQTSSTLYETPAGSQVSARSQPTIRSLVADYHDVIESLGDLPNGVRLLKNTEPASPASTEPKVKTEAATVAGHSSARLRHSYNTHGSEILQADIDGASVAPEDSVSMVGQMPQRVVQTPPPVEQKSAGYLGSWFSFFKSP